MSLALAEHDVEKARDLMARAAGGDRAAQTWLCSPENNPDAAAFFIFNFCLTQDEERGGSTCRVPPPYYSDGRPSFALRFVEFLERVRREPVNGHDEKSRRKLHTWLSMHHSLWELMWCRGTMELLLSKGQDEVDDGGRLGTTYSQFGRVRFAYDRLPEHVRKPVVFSHMSATCVENDAWLMGRAPGQNAGRSGGFTGAKVDECAFVEWMSQILLALDPACKVHKLFYGTVNGPDNEFARIKRERPPGWIFFEQDWHDEDPLSEKIAGLRPTVEGPERDRYGELVSDWFVRATASLTDEMIAQEYLRKYDKSTQGMILREFSYDRHVVRAIDGEDVLRYDPGRELRVALDLGHARKFVGVVGQPLLRSSLDVIGVYEGENRTTRENADSLAQYLRTLGYEGRLSDVVCVLPHDAFNEEQGSGLELAAWIRAAGFTRIVRPLIEGPDSVFMGDSVVRVCLQRGMVRFAEVSAKPLIDAIPGYRYPIDKATNQIKSNVPVKNMSTHPCDSLRYIVTSLWRADDLPLDWLFMGSERRGASTVKHEPSLTREAVTPAPRNGNGDAARFRPIVQVKRRF